MQIKTNDSWGRSNDAAHFNFPQQLRKIYIFPVFRNISLNFTFYVAKRINDLKSQEKHFN